MGTLFRMFALVAFGAGARAAWHRRVELLKRVGELRGTGRSAGQVNEPRHLSGPESAVDHDRQPGVPPPANDDYEDDRDVIGAASFPASDPPSGW